VGEAVADTIRPVQEEYKRLLADKGYLEQVMRNNAEAASRIAWRTLAKVRKKVGFVTV
jgi:tryptophanyl-tRNA synthetase